jgi:hypothetical protein
MPLLIMIFKKTGTELHLLVFYLQFFIYQKICGRVTFSFPPLFLLDFEIQISFKKQVLLLSIFYSYSLKYWFSCLFSQTKDCIFLVSLRKLGCNILERRDFTINCDFYLVFISATLLWIFHLPSIIHTSFVSILAIS